jgi:type I restriction enzyme S subunit
MTAGPTIVVGRKGSIGEISFSYQPCWPIDTTYFIDTTCTKQDLRWLSRALATLGLAEMNKSAAVPGLNREDAYRRRLLLPPLPEQRRIAAILDEADALRAKRRAALAQLEELIQSMFLELISGHQSRHWSRVMLPDAFWFQEGPGVRKWQFTESGVKLLNVGNIERDGSLNLAKTDRHVSEEEAYRKYRHFLADEGDLVIASSGISFDDDGLLRTRGAFVSLDHLPLCMNTSTIRFKALKDRSDLRFLWVWLNSVEFRSQITRLVTGSAQQNFGPSHLKALEITLPPLSVQASFADQVAGVEQLRKAARIASVELDSLFASLQKRAFRGEL